ncbi:actin family [Gorgonomyces haynaldii]|nr:actin family [Gorgonomyces haynaldii]
MQEGRLKDLEEFKRFMILLLQHLSIDRSKNDRPVLLTVPVGWTRREISLATQVLFEQLNIPMLYMIEQPLASIYACGVSTGVVIDIGHETTTFVPIFENTIVNHAVVKIPLGGRDIEQYLATLLSQDPSLPKGVEFARLVKEKMAVVSHSPGAAKKVQPEEFEHNKKKYMVGNARALCCEVLFDTSLINQPHALTVQEALYLCVTKSCEADKRLLMWESLILTGGSSLIKGMKTRIEKEAGQQIAVSETSNESQAKEVKWQRLPAYLMTYQERPHQMSFLGGAIVAKVVFLQQGYNPITKNDYNEYGPDVHLLK